MIQQCYTLELITPGFCGGADPSIKAEIRPASIRGQLRWWFRALGGFRSLAAIDAYKDLRKQEEYIFGSAAGEDGEAGKLVIRTHLLSGKSEPIKADDVDVGRDMVATPRGYLLFPLRPQQNQQEKPKAVFWNDLASFELSVLWKAGTAPWASARDLELDILALCLVFGELGALGNRSRRGFGAMALTHLPKRPSLTQCLSRFTAPSGVQVMELSVSGMRSLIQNENTAIQSENTNRTRKNREKKQNRPMLPELSFYPLNNGLHVAELLGLWLKAWRSHGKSPYWLNPHRNERSMKFGLVQSDHDAGWRSDGRPVYRAALGLPILQFFSANGNTVPWEESYNAGTGKGSGRFASPVLLRPHRDSTGQWRALVIFVDSHKWPQTTPARKAHLDGVQHEVALDLYEAMKADTTRLQPFP